MRRVQRPLAQKNFRTWSCTHDADVCPREIREGALIVTVDAARGKAAHGTMHQSLSRGDAQGELGCHLVQMPRLQV